MTIASRSCFDTRHLPTRRAENTNGRPAWQAGRSFVARLSNVRIPDTKKTISEWLSSPVGGIADHDFAGHLVASRRLHEPIRLDGAWGVLHHASQVRSTSYRWLS